MRPKIRWDENLKYFENLIFAAGGPAAQGPKGHRESKASCSRPWSRFMTSWDDGDGLRLFAAVHGHRTRGAGLAAHCISGPLCSGVVQSMVSAKGSNWNLASTAAGHDDKSPAWNALHARPTENVVQDQSADKLIRIHCVFGSHSLLISFWSTYYRWTHNRKRRKQALPFLTFFERKKKAPPWYTRQPKLKTETETVSYGCCQPLSNN
jgi:hypothetical protein